MRTYSLELWREQTEIPSSWKSKQSATSMVLRVVPGQHKKTDKWRNMDNHPNWVSAWGGGLGLPERNEEKHEEGAGKDTSLWACGALHRAQTSQRDPLSPSVKLAESLRSLPALTIKWQRTQKLQELHHSPDSLSKWDCGSLTLLTPINWGCCSVSFINTTKYTFAKIPMDEKEKEHVWNWPGLTTVLNMTHLCTSSHVPSIPVPPLAATVIPQGWPPRVLRAAPSLQPSFLSSSLVFPCDKNTVHFFGVF